MKARLLQVACLLLIVAAGPSFADDPPVTETVPVKSRQITNFKIGSDETRFGALEFIGGIEMWSPNPLLGALSSIRFRPDGKAFLAVMDTGHWVEGEIRRDGDDRLSGVGDLSVTSMMDRRGRSEKVKYMMDSEGLALRDGRALVSYEGIHRVDAYPDPGFRQSGPVATLPILIPKNGLRNNRSLETLAVSPKGGPLGGGAVIVSELSFDRNDHLYAAVLDGPRKGVFGVVQKDPFAVTDGAFLPNGDLLLLERRFSFAGGLGMQIRRIPGDSIKPGAVVDGEILLSADLSYQIDNMEGMDVIVQPDGDIHLILISDDNHSVLQRNLMLEFRLLQ